MLEEGMSEAYTKLVMPIPVGESQKSMERQRKEYADEELAAPVQYPEGVGPGTYEAEPIGIASPGEYTKQISGMTDIDFYESLIGSN